MSSSAYLSYLRIYTNDINEGGSIVGFFQKKYVNRPTTPTSVFTLPFPPSSLFPIQVFVNGILQFEFFDYNIAGSTIIINDSIDVGESFAAFYFVGS